MPTGNPVGATRIGLVVVDPGDADVDYLEQLAKSGLRATLFVPPERLASNFGLYVAAVKAGQELGDGTLLGVTDDGRLRNWTCKLLEEELAATHRLIRELGQADVSSIVLPGRFHVCAEGNYRRSVQRKFPVCLGSSSRLSSIGGVTGSITFDSARFSTEDGVLFLHPSTASIEFALAQAAALGARPLSDLFPA